MPLPLAIYSVSAIAEEGNYPNLSGELTIEVQDDYTYKSDYEESEINDLYPTITLGAAASFTE